MGEGHDFSGDGMAKKKNAGVVVAVAVSKHKGTAKKAVGQVELRRDHGVVGDAHVGGVRQVSVLAEEAIDDVRSKGHSIGPGDFAENILMRHIDGAAVRVGDLMTIGDSVILEVTQIGKECHSMCSVGARLCTCIMPKEGIFARVVEGGFVRPGDRIVVKNSERRERTVH